MDAKKAARYETYGQSEYVADSDAASDRYREFWTTKLWLEAQLQFYETLILELNAKPDPTPRT
jgi:hypothetical protein